MAQAKQIILFVRVSNVIDFLVTRSYAKLFLFYVIWQDYVTKTLVSLNYSITLRNYSVILRNSAKKFHEILQYFRAISETLILQN